MKESIPKMREQFEPSTSQGNRKLCLHWKTRSSDNRLLFKKKSNETVNAGIVGTLEMNNKPVGFLLNTGMVSKIVPKRIWDHCKTTDAALEPLDETLETCSGGPVKAIGKGKCSVKLISFESEVEIILVDELTCYKTMIEKSVNS
ncbi:hypothetical protein BpHYR1_052651 [Brachionus plicatilis]|uniref:Uncharacterized protein n=1 Tax=Brachionus plicatilis TaxID=10195 RepID=A0A3M7QFV8_BRAPC|nr:hypothetical protein BpHYR1_052651 [Brachionus plicatilis]